MKLTQSKVICLHKIQLTNFIGTRTQLCYQLGVIYRLDWSCLYPFTKFIDKKFNLLKQKTLYGKKKDEWWLTRRSNSFVRKCNQWTDNQGQSRQTKVWQIKCSTRTSLLQLAFERKRHFLQVLPTLARSEVLQLQCFASTLVPTTSGTRGFPTEVWQPILHRSLHLAPLRIQLQFCL